MPHAEESEGRLRVVVVGLNYSPETTGIAPYTTAFARHMAEQEYEVTAITGHPHYPEWKVRAGFEGLIPPEDDRGVHLVRVPHPVPRNPSGLSRLWMETVFSYRSAARLLQTRPHIVVVVSPALLALLPVVLFRKFRGYRVGVVVQDLYGAALEETGLGGQLAARAAEALERSLLRRADGIVVIHDVFRRKLVSLGIPAERIETIPNWVHVTMPARIDRAETRRRLGWGKDEFVALHAGNMGHKQGLEGLIDVAREAEDRGSPVRIVLMGDGSRKRALERYGIDAVRLSFMKPLPEGPFEEALLAADCLLLHEKPGVVEMSVPSKLTTYFKAARPVVAATDPRSGAASLMAASAAGVSVPAGDAALLLDAIEALGRDQSLADAYAASGRDFAADHLHGATSLSRQEAWVRGLLGRHGPRGSGTHRSQDEDSAADGDGS